MRLGFAGTPDFSQSILQSLLDEGYKVVVVLTQQDKAQGRGQKLTAPPVKLLAKEHGIPVLQPQSLKNNLEVQKKLQNFQLDVLVVVAYGLILPKAILDIPKYGCFNIHASILPAYRGAAPIQHAILKGDAKTGITIMQMDEGMDTGNMLHILECGISEKETSATLFNKLQDVSRCAISETLNLLKENKLRSIEQNNTLASYAPKIQKTDGQLNWLKQASALEREIRAYQPWPVSHFEYQQAMVKVFEATILPDTKTGTRTPGKILEISSKGVFIETGENILVLQEIQFPGKKRQLISNIYHNLPFLKGDVL